MKVNELKYGEAIHCSTEEEANKLCQLMHQTGLNWCNGKSYLELNNWEIYEEQTCYYPKGGEYCDYKFFEENNYKIYPAKYFLKKYFRESKLNQILK